MVSSERLQGLRNARIAAVQFVYSSAFNGLAIGGASARSFMASPVFKESRDNMDMALFSFLVRGLGRNVKAVDAALGAALSKGGTDAMTMAVLRLGAFEILFGDTPRAVASKEYTDIAACFVSARRTALVNAVLSALKG